MTRKGNTRIEVRATERVITDEDVVIVGLDVHKASCHLSVRVNGEELVSVVTPSTSAAVIRAVTPYQAGLRAVIYEAGPTGYGLARALMREEWPVMVVAPGKTPQPANRGTKFDRRDAGQLSLLGGVPGALTAVAIPTEGDDHDRAVVRLRAQLTAARRRAKQHIRSFLLYHGIAEPEGLKNWANWALKELEELPVAPQERLIVTTHIAELRYQSAQIAKVEHELDQIARSPRHAEAMGYLTSIPGVGSITAIAFRLEVFDPERFTCAGELVAYVGLAPGIWQSGETQRARPLIKAGRRHLRALLVEAAWQWKARDAYARRVYDRTYATTRCPQKAIVAVARHLAIRMWHLEVHRERYRAAA